MSMMKEILKEEIHRLATSIANFETDLNSMPKGSIVIQRINGNNFVYRKYREEDKIISIYIGKENSKESNEAIENANRYKVLRKKIHDAKGELVNLKKAYSVYDKVRKTTK